MRLNSALIGKALGVLRNPAKLRTFAQFGRLTFSQYAEDIIFDRLMNPGNQGTYLDVGANHPVYGSNTFRLYNKGWRGVAIDPNPKFSADFAKTRPADIYLTEGAARHPATLTYHAFANDVFNTFDPGAVKRLVSEGQVLVSSMDVHCRTLAEIVDEHLPGKQIDFLNVDCEGLDLDVIASLDLDIRRPTTILIEDYPRYLTFQQGIEPLELETFLRQHRYLPLAQTAWSGLYVAEDWRELFKLSRAFDEANVRNGYLPGQASLN